jgi:hypothetical protein
MSTSPATWIYRGKALSKPEIAPLIIRHFRETRRDALKSDAKSMLPSSTWRRYCPLPGEKIEELDLRRM